MDRYYFDVENGAGERDGEGVELKDAASARTMEARTVGEMLNDGAASFWASPALALTVRDGRGGILCRLTVTGTMPGGTG